MYVAAAMCESRMITILLILSLTTLEVLSNKFRGGIIMVRPKAGGAAKEMEISYHVSWEQDTTYECNSSAIEDGNLLDGSDSIDCLYSCSGTITRMSYTCTCYSAEDDWSFGENKLTYVFNDTTDVNTVTIGSIGGRWSSEVNGTWNISTTFSLATRDDTGEINSSPHAATTPLLRLQEGCEHTIPLAVSDPDDNDTIRCRWAVGKECGGICDKFSGAYLDADSCTIKYHANYGTGIKAVAVMIEDYAPGSSHPLSSVALQFLVSVFSSPEPCSTNISYFKPSININSSSNVIIKSHTESLNLTLTCIANEASFYYWEKENDSIPYDSIGENSPNLTLVDVQTEDSGNYRCVVTDKCNVTSHSDYTAVTIVEDKCDAVSHYHLGFFYNYNGGSLSFILTTTEPQPVSFSIEAPSQSYNYSGIVTANSSATVNLPSGLQTSSYYHYNYGIYLKANSDKITVIGQSYNSDTSDTYLALPTVDLKVTEYIYYAMSSYDYSYSSMVLIVGTEDGTSLKLTTTSSTYVATGSSSYFRRRVYGGSQYSFTINRLQTMYIAYSGDVSGTKIVTNKPVSVFSGHQCANVPDSYGNCGYLIEQIPPTIFWGEVYYVAPLATRRSYTIKVLAAYDSTYVTINCNGISRSYSLGEQGYTTRTLDSQEYCAIHANKEILVAQFSGKYGEDPSMTLVPATNNFMSRFHFPTFHHSSNYPAYINIIVMAQYYQPESIYLTTGGSRRSLDIQEWTPFRVNNTVEAYATKVAVSRGVVEIIHTDVTALMTTMVYGVATRNSYTHPGGFANTVGKPLLFQFQSPLQNVDLTETATLGCFALGYNVSYQWIIGSGSFPSKVTGINNSTLVISDVRSSDENTYTCVATTYKGCVISNDTQLTVTGLPSVTVSPSILAVEITLTGKLTATVTGVGPFTYQWQRGDQILTDETKSTYTVYNASHEDQNYYVCIVTNSFGDSSISNRVWLQITRNLPHFIKHPMTQVVGLKSNFTNISLTCEADGASSYRWERQYDSIPSSAIGVNTNTLTLINLRLEDAGQYRCVATNNSGSTESDYAVLILRTSSSTLVTHPVDTIAAAPFSGVFSCSVYGYGYQRVTWYKASGILPYKHEIKEVSSSRIITSTLIIPNVTEEDVGKYYCQAWTRNLGTQSDQANLFYSGIPPKPIVEMQPGQLINLTVNDFVLSMKCTFYASGFDYKWEKKNERNIPRAHGMNSKQLTITNLKPEDSGEYRCILSNSTGVIMSDYTLLTIKVALPVITRQPSSTVVPTFSIGSFECTARSYGIVSTTWKRLNSELPESVNIMESQSLNELTSVLSLENIGYYKGFYYCEIENSVGIVNSTFAHYDISVPCPEMILNPEPIKVRPDTTVSFSCVAWSYGGLMYEWNKNDSLNLPYNSSLTYEDRLLPLSSVNTTMYQITVYNVQETNEGHYCCIASNDCGSTTKCAWLEVDTSPIITLQPTSRTFKYNKRNVLAFEIVATGVGQIEYMWQKYNPLTDSWIPVSGRAINDTSPTLNFSVITEEDQGMYHCMVSNYDGNVTSDNATITVFVAPTITYHSPTIIAFEGNRVDLVCNATNDPDATDPVQVSWYYGALIVKPDGENVVINNKRNNATGEIHSVLSLYSVNYTNDGVYVCRVFNHPLSFTENKIQLTIEYPPRVSLNPPGPKYTVSVGTRLFLYCIAQGLPTPIIRWYENGILIPQQSSPLYLALTDTPKVTLYTCEAKNNAGNIENTASRSITVTVKRNTCPPLSDPTNGKVFQLTDRNAAVFSCDDGYIKNGESYLQCVNGNWSSSPPTCLKSP